MTVAICSCNSPFCSTLKQAISFKARKLRFADRRRGKGRRGGLRVIYYFWTGGPEFWLFTIYDKDEADDLTAEQRVLLQRLIKSELRARSREAQ